MIRTPDQRLRVFVGYARLAFARADPGRAALLAGAAEGLRRRAGLRAWPMLRRGEAQLVAEVRQALSEEKFGQIFTAGTRLNQQEAVTAVRDDPDAAIDVRAPRPR